MSIIHEQIEQGSADWHKLRLGKVTASRVKDVLKDGRFGNPSKTAESYMIELAGEILTGQPKPFFENDAMRWGTETEPQARSMFEIKNNFIDVKEVTFIEYSQFIGVSPDGLIGDDGMLEIKCPTTATQLKRALSSEYHKDYKAQIQMQLWVADREWCEFVSFDPRLPESCGYLQERVYRDEDFIKDMQFKVMKFVEELKSTIEKLSN